MNRGKIIQTLSKAFLLAIQPNELQSLATCRKACAFWLEGYIVQIDEIGATYFPYFDKRC